MQDLDFAAMRLALKEARQARTEGEVPVGAAVVFRGKIIASAHNLREKLVDPTAHAEMLVIRQAARLLKNRRLQQCSLYVTLEPCAMCAGAASAAGIGKIIFGAYDVQKGCTGSRYSIPEDPEFGNIICVGGVLAEDSQQLLDQFFASKREKPEE